MSDGRDEIPTGYRQAIVTALSVILGFSLYFFRYWGLEADGKWTIFSVAAASIMFASIALQLYALWRSLSLADDNPVAYQMTVRWFMAGVILALVGVTIAVIAYPGSLANP